MKPKSYFDIDIKSYFGGKGSSGTYQTIINQIPPHDVFVSGFLGGCRIMRYKKPAKLNYGYDLDKNVVAKWNWAEKNFDGHFQAFATSYEDLIHLNPVKPVFIYFDPPYPLGSRKSSRSRYRFEMTDNEHKTFLQFALNRASKFKNVFMAISTYPNEMYEIILSDWRKIKFESNTRHGMAEEWLYMNYPEPDILHDYSYLGNDFRSREVIKKRFRTMKNKFEKMAPVERNMLFDFLKKEYDFGKQQKAEASPFSAI